MTVAGVVPKPEIKSLFDRFTVSDPLQINNYLDTHPMLVSFLCDAYPIITRHFQHKPVALKVKYDPEGGNGILFGMIQTSEEAATTLISLDELDTDPEWIALYTPVRSLFILSVEYV